MGPQTEYSQYLHSIKYRLRGEDFRECMNRIASALTSDTEHFRQFREVISEQRFLPGGRIQSTIGTTKKTTANNCYVSGIIEDDSDSIFNRLNEAWTTMRMGGGIGYDFSRIRPSGDLVRSLHSTASGPVSFMEIYNSMGLCVASAGHRRGAQMGILRVDHPDIEQFIHAKQNRDKLTGFNLSVAVTNEFMRCVKEEKPFTLRFEGREYQTIEAAELWEQIMRSTWDWGEPGVVFIDNMNAMNNLYYCENIEATNPCSEQPLPPYGACLLGSFNLPKYLTRNTIADMTYEISGAEIKEPPTLYSFDFELFLKDIHIVVAAMDRVVDVAKYPLAAQRESAHSKRRMGLGVTGLANALEAMGAPYGSPKFLSLMKKILKGLMNESYLASALLAQERGPFPLFDADKYLDGEFVQGLDPSVQDAIRTHGIRNSHLTSIAPTGTISQCADNVSGGIEPVFSYEYNRIVNLPQGEQTFLLEDYGRKFLKHDGVTCDKVSATQHVEVLSAAQEYVDSAISKTCNVPPDMPWEDFKEIYMKAWHSGAKSCATFNSGGKRMALLTKAESTDDDDGGACYVDPDTGLRECG